MRPNFYKQVIINWLMQNTSPPHPKKKFMLNQCWSFYDSHQSNKTPTPKGTRPRVLSPPSPHSSFFSHSSLRPRCLTKIFFLSLSRPKVYYSVNSQPNLELIQKKQRRKNFPPPLHATPLHSTPLPSSIPNTHPHALSPPLRSPTFPHTPNPIPVPI